MQRKIISYNPNVTTKSKPLVKVLRNNIILAVTLHWNELKNKRMKGYNLYCSYPMTVLLNKFCKFTILKR